MAEEMLQKTGDRLGVDLVSYYSDLPLSKVVVLLEARKIRSEIDKLPAIDNFSQYIPKLERAKTIFKENSADAEVAYNAAILSRFYVKGFKHEEAKREVDEFLQPSVDASYKLCQAGLIWVNSQLAHINGNILDSMSLNEKSLEVFSQIDSGNIKLAPLMVGVEYQIETTDNDSLAFTNGLEGLKKSVKREEGNKRLAAFASRFAGFQGVTADKMKMPNLAEAYIKYAISICDQHDVPAYRVDYYTFLATLKASSEKTEEALSLLEKAKSFGSKDYMAQKEDLLATSIYKGKIHGLLGNYETSEASYREALELSKELGRNQLIYTAEIRKGLGEALQKQGKKVEAKKELIESKKMYDKARAAYQSMKAPLTRPSFTNKSVEELLDLVEVR
ncbi:MAG: tetratricopeptide repeat protein [Blastocatellia bacterium]|nr:tetratricopeptide repeat protein [Blastocatellia bacterium]